MFITMSEIVYKYNFSSILGQAIIIYMPMVLLVVLILVYWVVEGGIEKGTLSKISGNAGKQDEC